MLWVWLEILGTSVTMRFSRLLASWARPEPARLLAIQKLHPYGRAFVAALSVPLLHLLEQLDRPGRVALRLFHATVHPRSISAESAGRVSATS